MVLKRVHRLLSMLLIVHSTTEVEVEIQSYSPRIFVLEHPNVRALGVPFVLLSAFVLMLQPFNALVLLCSHLQFLLLQLASLNLQILLILTLTMKYHTTLKQ